MQLCTFDGTGEVLDSGSTMDQVAGLATAGELRIGQQFSRIMLTGPSVGGAIFDIEVRFENGAMSRVEFVARRPGDARTWDEWRMDQETARKAFHEEWATRVLGARFEALRVEVDGKWISTEWPEPAPKQATFPWGQLRSVYDGHSSQALLVMMIGFVGG